MSTPAPVPVRIEPEGETLSVVLDADAAATIGLEDGQTYHAVASEGSVLPVLDEPTSA